MKLYHGTSSSVANIALTHGLQPRGERPSIWTAFPSRPDCVYLTSVLAGHFALNHESPAILEIDASLLDLNRMLPDEDFVEQVSRPPMNRRQRKLMKKRTKAVRDSLEEYAGSWDINGETMLGWQVSLKYLGTCAYQGTVPASAISRVVYLQDLRHPIIDVLRLGKPHIGHVHRYG